MKPILLVDCYQDGASAAPNFTRYIPHKAEVFQVSHASTPDNLDGYAGIVISGSSASVNDPPAWIPPLEDMVKQAARASLPVLGVCFGHQLIAHVMFGHGSVQLAPRPEVGFLDIECLQPDPLFDQIPTQFTTFVSHADEVVTTSSDMTLLARSKGCANQAFRVKSSPMWGVQFHSEMNKDEHANILKGRAIRHPELHLNPELEIAKYVDASPIARLLFGNFIREVQRLGIQ